jgi:hypothetical protein
MECRVYQVGSWSLAASFQASHPGIFSPDESLFAVGLTPGVLALCHGADFQEFARLWNPAGNPVVPLFMTPDNSRLIAADTETNQLMFWDLGLLRKGLADLGLAAGWPDIRVSHNSTVQPIQVAKQHVLTESQSETVRSDSSAPKSQ